MSNSSSFCPVPKEQQPINEYQELQTSWFFGWVKLDAAKYITKLIWVGVWSLIVTAPLAAASFPIAKYPLQFGICAIGGSLIFIMLAAIRLYLGWIYVKNRLYGESIFYEESGWYDGQTWIKTPEILTRDRLLVSYEIQPILSRIKATFLALLGAFISAISYWLLFIN
ncbi:MULTISPECIES: CGLD27 family protein [unclassified Chamaesiphon]|uniref:CGLD27 family protein n=1 Tax=unclassified Chamaesiphon TaxID=2620921 RepID=UPI00286C9F97|nr:MULTISPECIES: CGLD27 family protein [unclassified Chamaesiphon]